MLKRTTTCTLAALATSSSLVYAQPRTLPEVPESRTLVPYVYGGVEYDSNVFRVSDEQESRAVSGSSSMGDTIGHYGVGFRLNKPISLQTIRLEGAIERVDYNRFSALDHTAGFGLAAWDWEIGRLFDGTLSHRYERGISNFREFQQAARDIREVQVSHFDGGYLFLPDWRLELGGEFRNVNYDQQQFLDRKEGMGYAELQYLTTADSLVGFRFQNTEADLQATNDASGQQLDNDYVERAYSLVVGWQGTGKSYFEGRAGVTNREQDDPDQDDFTGFTGRLTHLWDVTPITSLESAVYREVNALDFQIAGFVVSEGVSFSPRIQITPDTGLSGRVAYAQDNFEGQVRDQSGVIVSDSGRTDDVVSARLAADYQAILDLNILLGVQYQNRDSNQNDNDFNATEIFTEISYGF